MALKSLKMTDSTGLNMYEKNICDQKGESVHHEEVAVTEKPVETKHKGQTSPTPNPCLQNIRTNQPQEVEVMESLDGHDQNVTTSWFSSRR